MKRNEEYYNNLLAWVQGVRAAGSGCPPIPPAYVALPDAWYAGYTQHAATLERRRVEKAARVETRRRARPNKGA